MRPPPASNAAGLQAQVSSLVAKELFASAELLCSFLLSNSPADNLPVTGLGSHAASLALYGDALFGKVGVI
jgi:hypothetical protein